LRFAEQRELEKILRDLTKQVGDQREPVLRNVQILGELDFIHAKAKYSVEVLGSAPRLSRTIRLRSALHPILIHSHGRKEVVPLDLEMNEPCNTLVIT